MQEENEEEQSLPILKFEEPDATDSTQDDMMPTLSQEEIDTALSINSVSNEEIDARLDKLVEELEERWKNKKNIVKDMEALGPAPSRVQILTDAIKEEFETPENAVSFVKFLVTKGPTPQQKLAQLAIVTVHVIGKLVEGVKEIRKREELVRQQIAVQGEIHGKTLEIVELERTKSDNTSRQSAENIRGRHEEAHAMVEEATSRVQRNSEEIESKFAEAERERENNINRVDDNCFSSEVSSQLGSILGDLDNI